MSNVKHKAKKLTKNLRDVFENFINTNEILLPRSLVDEAVGIINEIKPVTNSRKSASGVTLDFYAPSIWHVGCYLQLGYLLSRRNKYEACQILNNFEDCNFGSIFVYRGQTLPWKIVPTNWRFKEYSETLKNKFQINIFTDFINQFMTSEDALELDLFGRLDTPTRATALAQHYGLKTNFTDFTFDPLIATYFASLDDNSIETSNIERKGIVYYSSFKHVLLTSKFHFALPPIQTRRLFQQSGIFMDFGNPPPYFKSDVDYSEPWMFLQQNCGRIFFDRSYPSIDEEDKIFFEDYVLPFDPFIDELVRNIEKITSNENTDNSCILSLLHEMRKERPNWRIRGLDDSFFYTDDYFVNIAHVLERYIKIASMVIMKTEPIFDPLVTLKLLDADSSIYTSIKSINDLPYANKFQKTCEIVQNTFKILATKAVFH